MTKPLCGLDNCDCGYTIEKWKEYAQHKSGCGRYSSTVFDTPAGKGVRAPGDCTCGLDALSAGLGMSPEERAEEAEREAMA